MKSSSLWAWATLLITSPAWITELSHAETVVNKCTDGKKISYTDKPCATLGLQNAGAINKDFVTIMPALPHIQVPQSNPRVETPQIETHEDSEVYQCITANGTVFYSINPCPQSGLLP